MHGQKILKKKIWDILVTIVTILGAQRLKDCCLTPCKLMGLISSEISPDGSWIPPNLFFSGCSGFFCWGEGLKWLQHEADYLPAYGAKVKNAWNLTSTIL